MCTISRNKFKRTYIKNKRFFLGFFLHFWNMHEIYKILEKKGEYPSLIISQMMDCKRGFYLNI